MTGEEYTIRKQIFDTLYFYFPSKLRSEVICISITFCNSLSSFYTGIFVND